MGRCPPYVFQGDRLSGGFGGGGIDGTDGDIVRTCQNGSLCLIRGMRAEATLHVDASIGLLELLSALVSSIEKILLAQRQEGVRQARCSFQAIIDD